MLNGCTRYQALYQARHNRVVDVVTSYIPTHDQSVQVLKDTCLSPRVFGADLGSFATAARRPDITVIDHTVRQVFIVEVAVPFDAFVNRCYTAKFDKYMPLCMEISAFGYACRTVVLVVGSLGGIHNRVVTGLKILGMNASTAKWLAGYLSVGAIIGSHRVWQKRCSDLQV